MRVLTTPAQAHSWAADAHRAGRRIGLVATMGALHAGHLALVAAARRHAELVAVSIFVNPLQFNRRDDFDAYPQPIDDDLAACRQAGVDVVYAPTAASMYPAAFETHVEPGSLAEPLEGTGRPGHFRGVTTVVSKLFNAVQPDVAVFGQKDYQQLAIIRRMVTDLDMPIEIIGLPTVRQADGLAMSSRNRRLTASQRMAAVCISEGLRAASAAFDAGERSSERLAAVVIGAIEVSEIARIEYVRVVDPDTLAGLSVVVDQAVIAVAAWFGEIRLIDNVVLRT